MASIAFSSSTGRPLRLRFRPDLKCILQSYLGREYWLVKDPFTLKYFRFEEEEFALLQWLDGNTSLEQLKRKFERRFSPQRITYGELHNFVGSLYRSSLVISDAAGQGEQLLTRAADAKKKMRWATLTNFLSIRFKGINPDRILGYLNEWVGWCFSPIGFALFLLVSIFSSVTLLVHWDMAASRLPTASEFFSFSNWPLLAVTLAVTKVLHELGHGIACKRFGGRSHEMGVMLLLFMPCLYCNVTDSWIIPNKWKRAAVGAAGMYVEFFLAAVCGLLWYWSQPGLLNSLFLNVVFVCSVSTLMINANPLMRYDGYYILSDFLEIPNLRQKANSVLTRTFNKYALGIPPVADPFLPQKRLFWFGVFAIAAFVYQWMMAISILWVLNKMFEPYGLKIFGQLIALVSIYGFIVRPIWKVVSLVRSPGGVAKMKPQRALLSLLGGSLLIFGIATLPLPYYITCPVVFELRDAASVFVDVPGTIRKIEGKPWAEIYRDNPILVLENDELKERLSILESQLTREKEDVHLYRKLANFESNYSFRLPELEAKVKSTEAQLVQVKSEIERLTVRAPKSGILVAPAAPKRFPKNSEILPTWDGSALESRNLGAALKAGTLVGQVGNPNELEATLICDQENLEFVSVGQVAYVFPQNKVGLRVASKVEGIASEKLEKCPPQLEQRYGGSIVTLPSEDGYVPASPSYEIRCPVDSTDGNITVGMTGTAKVFVGYRSLGERAWRAINTTFKFQM